MINLKKGNPFDDTFYQRWMNGDSSTSNLGSFDNSLLNTYKLADGTNRDILEKAYPTYFGPIHKPGCDFEKLELINSLNQVFAQNIPEIKAMYDSEGTKYLTGLQFKFPEYNDFIQFSRVGDIIDTIKEHYLNLADADLTDMEFITSNGRLAWTITTTFER